MMNHPYLMLFGASAGVRGVLMFGGASHCNGAENGAENAIILWPRCTVVAKSATKNAMQRSKNRYARSLFRMSEKYEAIEDALAWVAFCRLIRFYEKYGNVRESLDDSLLTQRTEALKKLQVILASMQRTIFL